MVQMQIRTLFLVLLVILFGVFVVLNWGAFIEPDTLSLGFGMVEAPLGLIMLILLVILLIVLLAYVVYLRSVAKMDVERYTKEMKTQRDLIDKAETAHFTDQREFLGEELRKIANRDNEFRKDVLAKFDKLERELRQALRKQETEAAINEREEFKQKLTMQLEEWKKEVNALKVKAAETEGEAKTEIDQQVNELELKIEEAEAKLTELAEVGEDAWDSVKKRVESSWDALRTAFNDAAAKIKD